MKLPALVFVSGKGGVGKTTVAALLARHLSEQGARTAVVEVNGEQQLSRWLGQPKAHFGPVSIQKNLDLFSLDALSCLQDFGAQKLGSKRIVQALLRHRVIENLVDGVPGFHDLFQLGKINHLLTDNGRNAPYDRVIVDTPSTGHAKSLFSAASSIRDMTVVGPVHDEAKQIANTIADPQRSGAILVTYPESLPISETLAFAASWQEEHPPLSGIVLNRWLPGKTLSAEEWEIAEKSIDASNCSELANIASMWQSKIERQREHLSTLRHHLPVDIPIGTATDSSEDVQQARLEWPNR